MICHSASPPPEHRVALITGGGRGIGAATAEALARDMLREAAPHLRTRTTPADVAKVIAFLCDPAESGCMTGATLAINSNL